MFCLPATKGDRKPEFEGEKPQHSPFFWHGRVGQHPRLLLEKMPRGPLEPLQESITSLSPYRFLKPQAPMMSDMFVGLNNKTLVGCTKAAGSFCCQRWQAESPYCRLDNGGARWYGIVLRHYTQLRSFLLSLSEEVIRHHARFHFLWITKTPRCFPSVPRSWVDEDKQSAWDCRVTAGFKCTSLEALRENPSENTHHLHCSCDLWAWWWSSGLWSGNLEIKTRASKSCKRRKRRLVCGDVTQRQISWHHWKHRLCKH